jgi:hypothetical protein
MAQDYFDKDVRHAYERLCGLLKVLDRADEIPPIKEFEVWYEQERLDNEDIEIH